MILTGCAGSGIEETKQCSFNAEEEEFTCSFFSTGKVFYVGGMKYIDNTYFKDGIGTEYFNNGAIYEGGWKMGNRSGQGTYTVSDKTACSSDWLDDKQNGIVTCIYTGQTEGHKREGLTNGTGAWMGRTIYTFPDGKKMEEFWENGKLILQRDLITSSTKN